MPQALASLYVHAVFSCHGRDLYLADPAFRADMFAFIAGASRTVDCPTIIVGGVQDHVHILARLGKSMSTSEWIKEVKRVSSITAKRSVPHFAWQAGYGAFSVSAREVETVTTYIRNQEVHHRKVSFEDELRQLFTEHGLEWDERYLWD